MIEDLHLKFATLESLQNAWAALECLCEFLPELSPDKWDTKQPVKCRFDKDAIAAIRKLRPLGLLWNRRNPRSSGSVHGEWFGNPSHAYITVRAESQCMNLDHALVYLRKMSQLAVADFACAHILTGIDVARWCYDDEQRAGRCDVSKFGINTSTHALRRGLPDLYGAVVFGPSYVRHFGRKRLLSAPAAAVEELGPEQVYLQICTGLEELCEDFAAFDARRKQVKVHLGLESFHSYPLWGRATKEVVLPSGSTIEERIDTIPSAAGSPPRVPKFDFDRYRGADRRLELGRPKR